MHTPSDPIPVRTAVYSGTFDPITLGHLDIVSRASGLFDRLIVAVAVAHHKKTLFTLDERIAQVQAVCAHLGNVEAMPFDGLIVDFCKAHGACAIVRGVRNSTDLDYEAQMAAMNQKMLPAVQTVFLLPTPQVQCISSTLVREIAKLGGDVGQMVSEPVLVALNQRYPQEATPLSAGADISPIAQGQTKSPANAANAQDAVLPNAVGGMSRGDWGLMPPLPPATGLN